MKNNNLLVSGLGESQASIEQKNSRLLKLGLDMHYRQVTTGMQEEAGRIKAIGKMGHEAFRSWVEKKLKEGWEIHSCYEAGASGYKFGFIEAWAKLPRPFGPLHRHRYANTARSDEISNHPSRFS